VGAAIGGGAVSPTGTGTRSKVGAIKPFRARALYDFKAMSNR